jgi:hypothetical protein
MDVFAGMCVTAPVLPQQLQQLSQQQWCAHQQAPQLASAPAALLQRYSSTPLALAISSSTSTSTSSRSDIHISASLDLQLESVYIAQVLAGLLNACYHSLLCLAHPYTGIVELLVWLVWPIWVANLALQVALFGLVEVLDAFPV